MTYSRRQLEYFGEPFGNSATKIKIGGRIYGGGGGATPTSTTNTQLSYPAEIKDLAIDTSKKAAALAATKYQNYDFNRIQGFDPLQEAAQGYATNLTTTPQLADATTLAKYAGTAAGSINYNPANIQTGATIAPNLQQYQMQGPERVDTGSFTAPGMSQAYMSPYIQGVVNTQQREAMRQAGIDATKRNAQAVGAGAFGGSRQGIMEAEASRNLSTQMNDIQRQGLQSAYEQAQGLYGTEQSRGLQAALANQQAGMSTKQANLQALLGIQQVGSQSVMQAQLANQQALLEAQRLAEQSRQYGAGIGLQGLQQQLAAAGQLGTLGQSQFGQQKDIINAMSAAGQQRQALQQQTLSQDYQDFLTQKQYPYQQLAYIQEMVKGTPQNTTQTMYQSPASLPSQIAGLGITGLAASRLYNAKNGGLLSLAVSNMSKDN